MPENITDVCCLVSMFTVLRDIQDRGRDLEQILHQYTSLVKPAFEEFCLPVSKLDMCFLEYPPGIFSPSNCLPMQIDFL